MGIVSGVSAPAANEGGGLLMRGELNRTERWEVVEKELRQPRERQVLTIPLRKLCAKLMHRKIL